jgi:hypothetical protein
MSDGLSRFLGGSPGSVLVRLIFVSLIVGALMAFLGLSPQRLWRSVVHFIQSIIDLGFDSIYQVGGWLIAGAIVVIPIWLVMRLLSAKK